jgi:hypothetical protein
MCPYCKSILNTGEFDWVLCEISQTQSQDEEALSAEEMGEIQKAFPDFSRQECEDKASNAFLQITLANATQKPERARHLCKQGAWDQLQAELPETPIAYERLFLEEVTLTKVIPGAPTEKHSEWKLKFRILLAYRRIVIKQGRALYLDSQVHRKPASLTLCRQSGYETAKGKLYAHQCSTCGGPIQDRMDVTCTYCGVSLNDGLREWVVDSFVGIPLTPSMDLSLGSKRANI